MSIDTAAVTAAAAIGAGATLIMDAWNLFLWRALGIPSLDYCLLGRWVRHFPDGTFRHESIGAAAEKRGECAVGWLAHYTIGVVLALGFVTCAPGWLARPTLLPALGYGLLTVVLPFFILQPSLGLGMAAARTRDPVRARVKSLVTHLVFGGGLYLSASGLRYGLGM